MRKHWLGGFLLAGLAAAVGWGAGYAQADAQQKAMVYELRTYTTVDGRLDALNARFRDYTVKLFEKHGMKNVIYLTPIDKPNTLVYLLAHKSKEAAAESFKAFRADAEWNAAREASEKDGKIVEKVESVFLNPTDYSPMK